MLVFLLARIDLPSYFLHVAHQEIRRLMQPQDGETYEAVVERMLPLADAELRRDVTAAVFGLTTQAMMLKVNKDEIDETQADLNRIDELPVESPSGRAR